MLPLSLASENEEFIIEKISGPHEEKHRLEAIGLIEGAKITIIARTPNGIIVSVKDTRIALENTVVKKISGKLVSE